MAMGECPPLRVLAGQADGRPLEHETSERKRLRMRPVDAALRADCLAPSLQLAGELRVDGEAVRDPEERLVQLLEPLAGNLRLWLLFADAAEPSLLRLFRQALFERRAKLLVSVAHPGGDLVGQAARVVRRHGSDLLEGRRIPLTD